LVFRPVPLQCCRRHTLRITSVTTSLEQKTCGTGAAPTLVTGASGCVGGHLALRLCREGQPVRALARPTSRVEHLRAAGVELVSGDIRDVAEVERAMAGCARVYHIAGVFRTAGHPDSYYLDVNVLGTENVLAAAKKHGVGRVVQCSTIGVHGDVLEIPCTEDSPFNPGDIYQRTKLEAEQRAPARSPTA
jgi:dihydroflavonol-4-reductase